MPSQPVLNQAVALRRRLDESADARKLAFGAAAIQLDNTLQAAKRQVDVGLKRLAEQRTQAQHTQ